MGEDHRRRAADRDPAAYLIWLSITWSGPWGRIASRLAPDRPAGTTGAWRGRLVTWCDEREQAWLQGYATRLARPPERWRRPPRGLPARSDALFVIRATVAPTGEHHAEAAGQPEWRLGRR